MDSFSFGGYVVAIFFLCVATSLAVASATWVRLTSGKATRAIGTGLMDLLLRLALIGGGVIIGPAIIVSIAFPQAAPAAMVHLFGILAVALIAVGVAALVTHRLFGRATTIKGVALLTVATALFYVAVGVGMKTLDRWLLQRAEQQRLERSAALEARKRLEAITLPTRQIAMTRKVPLAPQTDPYVSIYRCISPLLAAREAMYRSERRWPTDSAAVAAIAQDGRCRTLAASALPGGGLRITTEDDTLPPWGKKVAKKPEPHDPPLPPLELVFLPVPEGEAGALRWLCTAPSQPQIATRFQGCGHWSVSPDEIAGRVQ